MAAAKMETSAERYRRIKAERLSKAQLIDFESPSGMVWKLRRPDLELFIASGIMPLSLAGKCAEEKKNTGKSDAEIFAGLDWKDQARSIESTAKIVRYCAVSPRIVETPTGPDEIGYDEVEMDDFNAICSWALPGGDEVTGLDTFPGE